MRRRDDLGMPRERIVGADRLLVEYVDTRARKLTGVERLQERGLIDQPSTRAVDQERSAAHLVQAFVANQTAGGFRQRYVQRHEVRLLEHGIQLDRLQTGAPDVIVGYIRVIHKHAHLETERPSPDLAAHAAEADQPEGFAAQL